MIKCVISGGQSGADLAGNIWARSHSIPTFVRAYEGFKTFRIEDQKILESFDRNDYPECEATIDGIEKLRIRTRLNVKNSNATLIFIQQELQKCRGSRLTASLSKQLMRPYLVIDIRNYDLFNLITFMERNKPEVLNIAGERWLDKKDVINILNQWLLNK